MLGLGCTGLVYVKVLDNDPRWRDNPKYTSLDERTKSALVRSDSAVTPAQAQQQMAQLVATEAYSPSQLEIREVEHSACASISVVRFFLATNTDDLVAGFNINTNKWVLK